MQGNFSLDDAHFTDSDVSIPYAPTNWGSSLVRDTTYKSDSTSRVDLKGKWWVGCWIEQSVVDDDVILNSSTVCCGGRVSKTPSSRVLGTVVCGKELHDLGNTVAGGKPGGREEAEPAEKAKREKQAKQAKALEAAYDRCSAARAGSSRSLCPCGINPDFFYIIPFFF